MSKKCQYVAHISILTNLLECIFNLNVDINTITKKMIPLIRWTACKPVITYRNEPDGLD